MEEIRELSRGSIPDELERVIASRDSLRINKKGRVIRAAVMAVIRLHEGVHEMLFIKRPQSEHDAFSGQMAYPGGKVKSSDKSLLETAMRETLEETGLDLKSGGGRVIGSLDDVNPVTPRVSHYVVTPFVFYLSAPLNLHTNAEVAEAVWIPISHFIDGKSAEERVVKRGGKEIVDYVFKYRDYVIWGMTGRILKQFITIAGHLFANPR